MNDIKGHNFKKIIKVQSRYTEYIKFLTNNY